jgi:hypothetical protein
MAMELPRPALGRAPAGPLIDVTHLAAEVGLNAHVRFTPDVWAMCEPAIPYAEELMRVAGREQHARAVLAGLRRHTDRFEDGRLFFRSHGARRYVRLIAHVEGDELAPEITVSLA